MAWRSRITLFSARARYTRKDATSQCAVFRPIDRKLMLMTDVDTQVEAESASPSGRRSVTLGKILDSILRAGRDLLARARPSDLEAASSAAALAGLCHTLLQHRGEASGLALADEILASYVRLPFEEREAFFDCLNQEFAADQAAILTAAEAYRLDPQSETLARLSQAVEAPRLKLFEQLNTAPGGTGRLVAMRADLLDMLRRRPELKPIEADLHRLLVSWFNRGFLVMQRIDWESPASVLEKIVAYEAVHEINGFDDLRTRLAEDRRCFAFFHPAMPGDPVIFVQIALGNDLASAVEPLIARQRPIGSADQADTAVFYSISNCHKGLRGISFGNFLIKQVIEELRRDLENIEHFVTLSPVQGFRGWVAEAASDQLPESVQTDLTAARELEAESGHVEPGPMTEDAKAALMRLCAHYLLNEQRAGEPLDPVARFHLSNGAVLERINWNADPSAVGLERSFGIMVNYVYRLKEIERNHERYVAEGQIAASNAVRNLARSG